MNLLTKTLAAALIAGGVSSLAGSADAVPLGASLSLRDAFTPALQPVWWRGRWRGYGYPAYSYGYGYPAYSYGYGYPAYSYGYGYPAYSYGYAYPRYRSGLYVRRALRRW